MTITLTLKKRGKGGNTFIALVQIALSGSYVTGGDPIVAGGANVVGFIPRRPDFACIEGISGYIYQWDKANNKLIVRGSGAADGAPLAEFTSGAYSAALTGDTILARLEWLAVPYLPS